MKKLFLTIVLFVCAASITNAQELRCRVNMQYNDIANADKDLFNTLRNSIEDFMNAQSWTNHTYEEQEKIAGILEVLDRKIQLNTEINENLAA